MFAWWNLSLKAEGPGSSPGVVPWLHTLPNLQEPPHIAYATHINVKNATAIQACTRNSRRRESATRQSASQHTQLTAVKNTSQQCKLKGDMQSATHITVTTHRCQPRYWSAISSMRTSTQAKRGPLPRHGSPRAQAERGNTQRVTSPRAWAARSKA